MSGLILAWLVMASAQSAFRLHQAEFGVLPGHWSTNAKGFRQSFEPDSGYGRGIYAVPIDADSCFALDLNSTDTTPCSRVDPAPVALPNDSRLFYRFRCAAGWESRDVLFVAGDVPRPLEFHHLWPLLAPAPLPFGRRWAHVVRITRYERGRSRTGMGFSSCGCFSEEPSAIRHALQDRRRMSSPPGLDH